MLWEYFSATGTSHLVRVEGIIKKSSIQRFYNLENLKQSAKKLGLGCRFVFQHDNNPKHLSLSVKITSI